MCKKLITVNRLLTSMNTVKTFASHRRSVDNHTRYISVSKVIYAKFNKMLKTGSSKEAALMAGVIIKTSSCINDNNGYCFNSSDELINIISMVN